MKWCFTQFFIFGRIFIWKGNPNVVINKVGSKKVTKCADANYQALKKPNPNKDVV